MFKKNNIFFALLKFVLITIYFIYIKYENLDDTIKRKNQQK